MKWSVLLHTLNFILEYVCSEIESNIYSMPNCQMDFCGKEVTAGIRWICCPYIIEWFLNLAQPEDVLKHITQKISKKYYEEKIADRVRQSALIPNLLFLHLPSEGL